jgi:hypothetical protein
MNEKMTNEELEKARRVADVLNEEKTSTVHRLLAHIAALEAERDKALSANAAYIHALNFIENDLSEGRADDAQRRAVEVLTPDHPGTALLTEHAVLRRTIEELHTALGTDDGTPHGPGLVEAARDLRKKAEEADALRRDQERASIEAGEAEAETIRALRERVQALGAKADHFEKVAKGADLNWLKACGRADSAESSLSAIRQRAKDREDLGSIVCDWLHQRTEEGGPGTSFADCGARVASFILGDGAPTPESKADRLLREEQEASLESVKRAAEPTTAEAFATLEKGMQEWGRALENDPVERKAHAASRAALSLLERRMGAMARALQRLEMFLTGPTRHDLPSLDEVRTALTDAPAVFTLDEVEEAVGHVLEDWQNEWTVDEGKRRVRELLTAFRE